MRDFGVEPGVIRSAGGERFLLLHEALDRLAISPELVFRGGNLGLQIGHLTLEFRRP